MPNVFTGRVWKFGDDINTDLVIPNFVQLVSAAEMAPHCFSANRPGWVELLQPGDVIVAGRNFGVGSGRAIGAVFVELGISGIVAESFNGLGMRNCLNVALPVLPCPGVGEIFAEGEIAEVDWTLGTVCNLSRGTSITGQPLPKQLQDIVHAGGVEVILREEGFIA